MKGWASIDRLQKDQDGVEPMDSVKPNFSGAHEELLEDAVSIEDIDEVFEKLATAGIAGTETDEPVIGEVVFFGRPSRRRRKRSRRDGTRSLGRRIR